MKVKTFGILRKIPDQEYEEIKERTGMDMDGRAAAFNKVLRCIEEHVRTVVNFAKQIPGFNQISGPDKISMIRRKSLICL